MLKKSSDAPKEKSAKSVWKSNVVTRSMTVTNDKIGSEMLIIERKNSKKVLKYNCVTRSIKVTNAKLGCRTHEDEALSEKLKKKRSLKSFEVRAILDEKIDFKLRASTATNNLTTNQPVESMLALLI